MTIVSRFPMGIKEMSWTLAGKNMTPSEHELGLPNCSYPISFPTDFFAPGVELWTLNSTTNTKMYKFGMGNLSASASLNMAGGKAIMTEDGQNWTTAAFYANFNTRQLYTLYSENQTEVCDVQYEANNMN